MNLLLRRLVLRLLRFSALVLPEILTLLLSHGFPPSTRDDDGNTALHLFAERKDLASCKALVEGGADPTMTCKSIGMQNNALHQATIKGDARMVQLLLGASSSSWEGPIFDTQAIAVSEFLLNEEEMAQYYSEEEDSGRPETGPAWETAWYQGLESHQYPNVLSEYGDDVYESYWEAWLEEAWPGFWVWDALVPKQLC